MDKPACEDHDVEPHEAPEPDPIDNLIRGLRSDVSDLQARLASLQRQWDDFIAAVVRGASERES